MDSSPAAFLLAAGEFFREENEKELFVTLAILIAKVQSMFVDIGGLFFPSGVV